MRECIIEQSRKAGNLMIASSFRRSPAISAGGTGHADAIAEEGIPYYGPWSDLPVVERAIEAMKSSRESS